MEDTHHGGACRSRKRQKAEGARPLVDGGSRAVARITYRE